MLLSLAQLSDTAVAPEARKTLCAGFVCHSITRDSVNSPNRELTFLARAVVVEAELRLWGSVQVVGDCPYSSRSQWESHRTVFSTNGRATGTAEG